MREITKGIYHHFKGQDYKVLFLAIHAETGEQMVVYQALYGDQTVYVRPYVLFASKVDRKKYPDVSQHYRFEYVPSGGDPNFRPV